MWCTLSSCVLCVGGIWTLKISLTYNSFPLSDGGKYVSCRFHVLIVPFAISCRDCALCFAQVFALFCVRNVSLSLILCCSSVIAILILFRVKLFFPFFLYSPVPYIKVTVVEEMKRRDAIDLAWQCCLEHCRLCFVDCCSRDDWLNMSRIDPVNQQVE